MAIASRNRKPRVGDLFAGAGLFSEAFRQAGAKLEFAIEVDPLAAASYASNINDHVQLGSVSETQCDTPVDVIVAGPPCQGFSTLGRMDPRDSRNKLCLLIPQWAERSGAKVVVVENVPPFLASPHWRKMRKAFHELGFDVTTWTLDSADYGVPQKRRRSFTIASLIGLPAVPATKPATTAIHAFLPAARKDPMNVWPESSELAAQRMQHLPTRGDRRDLVTNAPQLCPPSWLKLGCQATDVWGRIDPNTQANTIRCDFQNPSKGRYIHPTKGRVISLREGARLQQIPENWSMTGHRTAITRQIGNGVPIGLGRAVADQIMTLF